MRISDAGPRTWLLATVAGWALLAWVLSLANMGGRIARLPDDAALEQKLPTVAKAQSQRIAPLENYIETSQRPLFSDDRRPQPFSLTPQSEDDQAQPFDFILTSVLITPQVRMAIVQPAAGGDAVRMKQDESPAEAQGWRLVAVEPRSATFVGPQGEKTLQLRVFDGKGGSEPTRPAAPAAPEPVVEMTDANEMPPPAAPPPPATTATADADTPAQQPGSTLESTPMTPEQQMEAIRRRIEQRRAQLRQEAQRNNNQTPQQKPPAQ